METLYWLMLILGDWEYGSTWSQGCPSSFCLLTWKVQQNYQISASIESQNHNKNIFLSCFQKGRELPLTPLQLDFSKFECTFLERGGSPVLIAAGMLCIHFASYFFAHMQATVEQKGHDSMNVYDCIRSLGSWQCLPSRQTPSPRSALCLVLSVESVSSS